MPNVSCVTDGIEKYLAIINNSFDIELVDSPTTNPLFRATGLYNVHTQLLKAPGKLINENQILQLNKQHPFIRLNLKCPLRSHLLIRVFSGTKDVHNHQLVAFQSVWESLYQPLLNVKIEYLYHDTVRNNCWGFQEIIEWLKASSIHFILCHMHQGIKFGNNLALKYPLSLTYI